MISITNTNFSSDFFVLKNPTAVLANEIEHLVRYGKKGPLCIQIFCEVTARAISTIIFPIFLLLELTFKKIPEGILAARTDQCWEKADDALKYFLAIVPAIILGLYSPEGVPGFFLKRKTSPNEVNPFGVENIYGKKMLAPIAYPKSAEEVVATVKNAIKNNQKISIIGTGFSQGTQTISNKTTDCLINTKYLNTITVNKNENTVTVGAGATWEQVQLALDKQGKSAIVKQASDPFSIGGSIGINCHGWAHQKSSIAETVRSLKVVDSQGNLRTLLRPKKNVPIDQLSDEEKLFKCMFGTLGYFGVVVEATLDIVDNTQVIELAEEVSSDRFVYEYESKIKEDENISLFGGRLNLDFLNGNPLRTVCMVSYKNLDEQVDLSHPTIDKEKRLGTRIERIAFKVNLLRSYVCGKTFA